MKYSGDELKTPPPRSGKLSPRGYTIEGFIPAKFLDYEDGQEVHLVEGLNCERSGRA